MRAIIIEDELQGRIALSSCLKEYCPKIELVGMAANVMEGLKLINKENPDLVFLDIEMPEATGIDLIESLGDVDFKIIFVTAYQQYGINALNSHPNVIYYLLKPLDIEELVKATALASELIEGGVHQNGGLYIAIPNQLGAERLKISEIIRCQAEGGYTRFFMENGESRLSCHTLKIYQANLESSGFIKVHRSHLVNFDHVKAHHKNAGGTVVMSDGEEIPISKKFKSQFIESFYAS